jgi:hypothetical protein
MIDAVFHRRIQRPTLNAQIGIDTATASAISSV